MTNEIDAALDGNLDQLGEALSDLADAINRLPRQQRREYLARFEAVLRIRFVDKVEIT